MYFTKGKQRAFELLMQQKPGFDRYQSGCAGDDEDCGTCRFYRPQWKYEFCVFKECPYRPLLQCFLNSPPHWCGCFSFTAPVETSICPAESAAGQEAGFRPAASPPGRLPAA